MDRRAFIALCVASGGGAVIGFPRLAAQTTVTPQIGTSIKEYGAVGDGRTDDARALVAACRELKDAVVRVPAGTYLMGNPLTIRDFNGTLLFEEGAKLQFAYKDRPGLRFSGGNRARLLNYHAGWRDSPTQRLLARGGVEFIDSVEPYLEKVIIENSNAAGIIFYGCIRPKISGAKVNNTMSDGVHFANCEAPHVENIITRNTGDDGLAFVNYAKGRNRTGGHARGITVQVSKARGISIVGQSNVDVFDFSVSDTASSGVSCITDDSYDTRSPENVLFARGRVERSGVVEPRAGNQYGVEIEQTGAVTLQNIDIVNSEGRGLSVNSPQGNIAITDVKVSGVSGNSGAEIRAKEVSVDRLKVVDAPRYGVYFADTPRVSLGSVTVIDAAASFDLHRAIWFDGNGQISADRLVVVDTRATSLGNVVGAGSGQSGAIAQLLYYIADGQGIRVENGSATALAFPTPRPFQPHDL